MYRVTSHIISSRSMLYCRPATELQVRTVSRIPPHLKYKKATERDTCPQSLPPPPPPPKDSKLFWGAVTMIVLTSGFAYYAKQSPEVRDWLTLHAPWFDDFIAIATQENLTYKEFIEQCRDDINEYINDLFDNSKEKCPDGSKPKIKNVDLPKETKGIICKPDENKDDEEKPKCEPLPPPVITKDICEVERCLRDIGETVVNNYTTAKDACGYYNRLVEDTMADFNMTSINEVHEARVERDDLIKQSNENICEATKNMEDLKRYLECGVQAPKESIDAVKETVSDLQDKITAARIYYQWESDKAFAFDSQLIKVEELVKKYTDENQTMFSGLRYDHKKPVLQGDADLLLFHTFRYMTKLKTELCEAASTMTDRINRAVGTLSQNEKDLKARNYMIQTEYKKRKTELDKEFKKRYDDLNANNDRILKEAMKKQLERHEEMLQQKLSQKEKETTSKLNALVAEKVAAEKKIFDQQLAEMAAKLKIVEDKLNARLKAEQETRRSQQLYAAGASLLAATKKGDPIIRVNKELKAIEKASGDDDKLVKTVLKAIPDTVRTGGLVPESALREKYHKMEKAALRVALVDQDGGPLPIFFLSWLQYMMLFMKLSGIPQTELDKPPAEPSKDLDTFDLLQRARFYIERGNLAAALRYVSSLEGASRAAAAKWQEAARSHLETKQAAEAVLAHAAALGLQYL